MNMKEIIKSALVKLFLLIPLAVSLRMEDSFWQPFIFVFFMSLLIDYTRGDLS